MQAEQQVDFARACEEVAADEGAPEQLKQNALRQFRSSREFESVKDFYRKSDGARTDRPDTDSLLAAIKDDQRDPAERKQLLNALVKDLAGKKLSDGEQVELAVVVESLATQPPSELTAYAKRVGPWLRKQSAAVRQHDEQSKDQ